MVEFKELEGDDLGVYRDDNYRLVECMEGHIVFSYAEKGKGMNAHFASDKEGLKHVEEAADEFCKWLFDNYGECDVIFGIVEKEKPSVMKMIEKIGFSLLAEYENHKAYMRHRTWVA